MKKNKLLGILVALLLVVGVVGTYANYASTLEAEGTVEVAKWDVKLTDGTDEYSDTKPVTFKWDDAPTVNGDKLAPGRTATATIIIDASESDVYVDYLLSVSTENLPENASINPSSDEGQIAYNGTKEITLTLTWDGDVTDIDDTSDGKAAEDITVDVNVTATQATEVESK